MEQYPSPQAVGWLRKSLSQQPFRRSLPLFPFKVNHGLGRVKCSESYHLNSLKCEAIPFPLCMPELDVAEISARSLRDLLHFPVGLTMMEDKPKSTMLSPLLGKQVTFTSSLVFCDKRRHHKSLPLT